MAKIVVQRMNILNCTPQGEQERCEVELLDGKSKTVTRAFLTVSRGAINQSKQRCPPDDPYCDVRLPKIPTKG